MGANAKNFKRLIQILWILGRYDAFFLINDDKIPSYIRCLVSLVPRRPGLNNPGQRLCYALTKLGPSFIKFGQALSTRPDLVGDEVAEELSELQDKLLPFNTDVAKKILTAEFNKDLSLMFSEFDSEPIAAASIAQVHLAKTVDGKAVAVKILRPGIENAFSRDLELFYWIAHLLERKFPAWKRLRPVEVINTFAESVTMEMDLRLEAAAACEIRENFQNDTAFYIPKVDWSLTSQRVLTLEQVVGIPIDERENLISSGQDLREVLAVAANAFFKQVFEDGFFHADLHAGNLFVEKSGRVIAVDFGIMGRLDKPTRRYLAEMLLGLLVGDFERVANIHFEAGYIPRDKSKALFTQAIRSIGEPILGKPLNEISLAKLLHQLFRVTKTFDMETQPQLLLLQKTLLMAEGICRKLNPEENMWTLARPQIESWARENLGPEAQLRDAITESVSMIRRLPFILERADQVLSNLEKNYPLDTKKENKKNSSQKSTKQFMNVIVVIIFSVLLAFLGWHLI